MAMQYILLTNRFLQEDEQGTVAAFCDELGLATWGRTEEEAERHLDEAISNALNAMTERGEIASYLKEHNVEVYTKNEQPFRRPLKTYQNFTFYSGETLKSSRRELVMAGA